MYRLNEDHDFLDTDTHLIIDLIFLGVFVLGILVEFANTMWILVGKLNGGIRRLIVWIREKKKSKVSDVGVLTTTGRAPNQETPFIAALKMRLGDPSPASSDLRSLRYGETPTRNKKKTGFPQIDSSDFRSDSDRETRIGSVKTIPPETITKLVRGVSNIVSEESRPGDMGDR